MIPNCTGRYICRDHKRVSHLEPKQLLVDAGVDLSTINNNTNDDIELRMYFISFEKARRKDPISVIPFGGDGSTGLISYVKYHNTIKDDEDGMSSISYVHTLNLMSGFRRKLEAIDVVLSNDFLA